MRRLFSTFATGLPGVGLLIMRLVAGTTLIFRGIEGLAGVLPLRPDSLSVVQISLGLLLLAGLWTPVVAALVAVLQLWREVFNRVDPWLHVLLATLGVALALLGPGGWSIDAWLFGWRRINIRHRTRPPSDRQQS